VSVLLIVFTLSLILANRKYTLIFVLDKIFGGVNIILYAAQMTKPNLLLSIKLPNLQTNLKQL
jgi:hypothetical protein